MYLSMASEIWIWSISDRGDRTPPAGGMGGGGASAAPWLCFDSSPDQLDDLDLGRLVRVVDVDVHQKAVHLRFGQRIGPFLLDRVLGGHDHEQRRQLVGRARHRDLALFHRLEQRRLHLGRGAVDLVGQHDVGEDRTGLETELGLPVRPGDRPRCPSHPRASRSGRELDAGEVRLEVLGQALDRPSLGQARVGPPPAGFHWQSRPRIRRSTMCSWPMIDWPMRCLSSRIDSCADIQGFPFLAPILPPHPQEE